MNSQHRYSVTAAILLLATLGAVRPDDAPKPLVLFDGKSLDGWKEADFGKSGGVKVEDGAIVLPVGGPMTGVACTVKDLPTTDYELSFEAMRTSGRDFFAAATFPVGKSHITLVNGGWGGSVTGLSSLNGADASENETNGFVKYEDKTWYRFRVRVTDAAIRVRVDDKEVVAVKIDDRRVDTRIEVRPCYPLGFASWNTGGAVRKVEVRKLTAEEVAANVKKED